MCVPLLPLCKSRRELKIKTSGVIFRGASAYYVQKAKAPPKTGSLVIFRQKTIRIFLPKNLVGRRKMKCRGSSEMRFLKVWGRTEPSGGKRPVKVNFTKFRRKIFRWKFDAIIQAQGFQNWQTWPLIFGSIIRGGWMIRQLIVWNQPLSSGFSLSSALISRPAV